MKAIVNGRILLKDRLLDGQALIFDEKITGFFDAGNIPENCGIIDAEGGYVSPGLIDIHCHGCFGEDAADGSVDGIMKMSEGLLKTGVTAWLPTTITAPVANIEKAFKTIRAVKDKGSHMNGSVVLGANMEGPYLNKKRKGAHDETYLLPPDAAFIKANADIIKIVTIAPELDDDFKAVRAARDAGVAVAIGHSDASYETAMAAIHNGARHVTHLFNAMSPLNHRDPGVVGAALDSGVTAELIADTFHIHADLFHLVHKIKGDRLVLITDSVRAGGLPDGEYDLGGLTIKLSGIECRLPDGTIAGSVLTMINAVKNMARMSVYKTIPLYETVACASLYPARVIGADKRKGSLETGKDADIIIFNDDFIVKKTIIGGRVKYEA